MKFFTSLSALTCIFFLNRCVFNSPFNKRPSYFMETTVVKKLPYYMSTWRVPNREDPWFITQPLPFSTFWILCKFITPLQSHKGLRIWQYRMVRRPLYQINLLATSTRNTFFLGKIFSLMVLFAWIHIYWAYCWIGFGEVCCKNRSWNSCAELWNKTNSILSYFSEL